MTDWTLNVQDGRDLTEDHPQFDSAYAGPFELPSLSDPSEILSARPDEDSDRLARLQDHWRTVLADQLYGDIPDCPNLSIQRFQLQHGSADHIVIEMNYGDRTMSVDAALWLPKDKPGPFPLICGLDFLGPAGILAGESFPLDPNAIVFSKPEFGAQDGKLHEIHRGVTSYRWPIDLLTGNGFAVLVSCYGSWTPDHPAIWKQHGAYPFLGCDTLERPIGAISLWAWAIRRLLDVAILIPEINSGELFVAGHSRLGKAALWAAGTDKRIRCVFANNSGCGGAAPARHGIGETLPEMARTYPHWTTFNSSASGSANWPFDQHALLSLIAPRGLYLGAAKNDLWSDPLGSYLALVSAASVWPEHKQDAQNWPSAEEVWRTQPAIFRQSIGYHLRQGGHDLLPMDWRYFLDFLNQLPAFDH